SRGVALLGLLSVCEFASAQLPTAQTPTVQPIGWQSSRESTAPLMTAHATPSAHGTMAILVRNPGLSPGEPPFALADPSGAIQRLVEPGPGANLESHVGQVVRVRHDSG